VLKVQAKGPSFDGRQFFKALLSAGKISDNQPPPIKDEPGLDLAVEIETVFGYYDTTVKSLVLEAKRRGGKLNFLEATGRLNGEAPINVHFGRHGRRGRLPAHGVLRGGQGRLHEFAREPRRLWKRRENWRSGRPLIQRCRRPGGR
jgi:hypothetical protein